MHYRNGREAKNGDKVIQLSMDGSQAEVVGVLHDPKPNGGSYCNGEIVPLTTDGQPVTACLCDCLHLDDLAAILAEKGLDKRPSNIPA